MKLRDVDIKKNILTRELLSFPRFVNALHQRGKQHRVRMPFLPRKNS